ncbi:hypothetical protein Tco_0205901 [Tanacetum coccineum]
MSTAYHPQTDCQRERTSKPYDYHTSFQAAAFESTVRTKNCRITISSWAEVGDAQLTGLRIIHETTEKIIQIKKRIQAARDRQKSYADRRIGISSRR